MESVVSDESTKDSVAISKKEFAAIVNAVARHETELNAIMRRLKL